MKINVNIPALQAVRHINKTDDKITSALKKLSSGYKINSVADDPSGMAVSSKVKAQLYGLKTASKNALDGVSLVQTAEGAMSEVHEMLKRMRELAVQAANDSNAPDDRQKVQMEIDELLDSIDQMADVTEFNQTKLLNGSLSNLTTVYDSASAQSRDLSVQYMSHNFPTGEFELEITTAFSCAEIVATYSLGEGRISLNSDTIDISDSDTQADIEQKITELADRYNCIVDFSNSPQFTMTSKEAGEHVSLDLSGSNITINPPSVSPAIGVSAGVSLTIATNGFTNAATAKVEGNRIVITETGGSKIQIDINDMVTGVYKINIEEKGPLKLQTGANEDQRISLMMPEMSTYSLGLRNKSFAPGDVGNSVNLINTKNTKDAQRSISLIDEAISDVSNMRATLGAYQNRLEHTVINLDNNSVNTEESLSRIQDTDMALEMSSYTLNNVILQSAISMLSQANERPQQLLQLLK